MTKSELNAIESRIKELPPAPWVLKYSLVMGRFLDCGEGIERPAKRRLAKMTGPGELLNFAAQARVNIPKLIAEVRRLQDVIG